MPDTFADMILHSVQAEMGAHHRYMTLAQMAPTQEARNLMIMNARDEHTHAEAFSNMYEDLTGREPAMEMTPSHSEMNQNMSFTDLLRMQIHDEHNDFAKYGRMMTMTDNPDYRDRIFRAHKDELRHAMIDTYLLT